MMSRVTHLDDLLRSRMSKLLEARQHRLRLGARALDTFSPLATLGRGYAIVRERETGKVLRNAGQVAPGATIEARLAAGRLVASVEDVETDDAAD